MAVLVPLPNGQQARVTIRSLLLPVDELKPGTIDAVRNACEMAAMDKAVQLWGEAQSLTIRDLNALDMSYTYNIITETSNASANAWNAMAFGAFTVATGTVLGIYGIKLHCALDGTVDLLPITGIRIDVGGARVAQWHVQSLDQNTDAASTSPFHGYAGITKSPVIIGEDIQVTMYEYTRTASTVYDPIWLGCAVEKTGRTLKP